jgi:hypothetical protein
VLWVLPGPDLQGIVQLENAFVASGGRRLEALEIDTRH